MSAPNLFLDFEKNPATSTFILQPFEDEESKDEAVLKSRDLLIDQVYNHESVSRSYFNNTHWAVLLRPLEHMPEINGKKDVNGYDWFVGHYDWDTLVTRVIELTASHSPSTPFSIFLVPTLGQSLQGSKRHELTYNAFVAPKDLPPFNQILQRLPQAEAEQDVELFTKADPITFRTLASLDLTWESVGELTKENFSALEGHDSISVSMLAPTKKLKSSIPRMKEDELISWYDCTMANFLPLIPLPTNDGKIDKFPLVLLDAIECTPAKYQKLIEIVDKINSFSAWNKNDQSWSYEKDGEFVRAIKNVIKFWQFTSVDIENILPLYYLSGREIPKGSKEFNQLFFDKFIQTREFIIDEIFNGWLAIKRTEDDEEPSLYRGVQADINIEILTYDQKMRLRCRNDADRKNAMEELRVEVEWWFDQDNRQPLYDDFKAVIAEAFNKLLDSPQVAEYIKIATEESSNTNRNEWLQMYYNSEALYCLWPTIYHAKGVLHEGDKDELLEKTETEELKSIHCTLPETKGKVLPPKTT